MNTVKVKICSTRTVEAAEVIVDAGADFLGMLFVPSAKAHVVERTVAKEIAKKMKGKIQLVGVFADMPLSEVQTIIRECQLDYAQLHGEEDQDYADELSVNIIKSFRYPGEFSIGKALREMEDFAVDYYLLDRIKQGEGEMLNLETASKLAKAFPLIFAGGLTPENVVEVVKTVKPQVVDVASGVETDGKQDVEKIRLFIKNAKEFSI